MLLDTNGKIVYKGHPATRPDLEADFDTLLKGEAITGPGTEAPKLEETKEGEAGKALDIEEKNKYIDKFANEFAPAFMKHESIQSCAKNMPRAFCVMVL